MNVGESNVRLTKPRARARARTAGKRKRHICLCKEARIAPGTDLYRGRLYYRWARVYMYTYVYRYCALGRAITRRTYYRAKKATRRCWMCVTKCAPVNVCRCFFFAHTRKRDRLGCFFPQLFGFTFAGTESELCVLGCV